MKGKVVAHTCPLCRTKKPKNKKYYCIGGLGQAEGNCLSCRALERKERDEKGRNNVSSSCHCCKVLYKKGPDTRRYFCSALCATDYKSESSFLRFKGLIDLSK